MMVYGGIEAGGTKMICAVAEDYIVTWGLPNKSGIIGCLLLGKEQVTAHD